MRKLCICIAVLAVFSSIASAQSACTGTTCLTVAKNGWIVGEIKTFAFGGSSTDTIIKNLHGQGWLECEGQTLDITEFANLRKAIGMTWGSKDPLNSFLVPDLRGMFLRGWNHSNSQPNQPQYPDPDVGSRGAPRPELATTGSPGNTGDTVGSEQASAFQSHTHVLQTYTGGSLKAQQGSWTGALINLGNNTNLIQPAGNSLLETRPSNAYVEYFIYVGQDVTNLDPVTGKIVHSADEDTKSEKQTRKHSK
jgi:hypothetical protein